MESFICKQCGGNSFHEARGKMICDFCQTEYIDPLDVKAEIKKEVKVEVDAALKGKNQPTLLIHPKKNKKIIILGTSFSSLIIIVLATFLSIQQIKKTSTEDTNSDWEMSQSQLLNVISSVPNWDKKLFETTSKPVTSMGTIKYSDLVKKVGIPQQISIDSDKFSTATNIVADWSSPDYSKYNVTVEVTYNRQNDEIYNCSLTGYENGPGNDMYDQTTTVVQEQNRVLNSMSSLKWSQALYDGIQVATTVQASKGITTYNDGFMYADLAKKVGEPTSTRSDTFDGVVTETVTWENKEGGIEIEYDKTTGQITHKQIL